MKLFRHNVMIVVMAAVAALFAAGCADDDGVDNRELDYGYVQFKLYKEASAPVSQTDAVSNDTRAVVEELDYLADACKIEIRLLSGSTTIAQTLTLNYADKESAEFGLRSDKLQLLAGEYQIVAFILYDAGDEPLYRGTTQNNTFEVVAGGLTVQDLTADVTPRGKVRFNLKKSFEGFDGELDYDAAPATRTTHVSREYTFDEIFTFDMTVHKVGSDEEAVTFTGLKADFSVHFDEENAESDEFGYQTSSITCDSLLSLPNDIGRLSKLEYLYIGNSPIGMLPDSIGLLKSCTLLEIYNCPNMHGLPATVKDMPALVQVNISCNAGSAATPGWTSDEVARAIEYFATGASKNIIQMLYARDNNLESVPASIGGMEHLGLLDLAYNKITGEVEAFGPNFAPEEVHFEHNRITGFKSVDYNGTRLFCSLDNLDSFSASYNNLTLVPDIFSSKTDYIMSGVEFAYNDITGFENGNNGKYQGINVSTLTLSGNRIKQFPACLAKSASQINYIIMSGNGMTGFEEGSFTPAKAENLANLISIDLTYNRLTELPDDFHAGNMPYLYGVDLSYNAFASFPWNPTDALSLTVYGLRGQRADDGSRCLRE